MNTKKTHIPSFLLALFLVLSMMAIQAPQAHAADSPVKVSSLQELQIALHYADDGAVISITGQITVPSGTMLGDSAKTVIIERADSSGTILFINDGSDETSTIQNIVFDGKELANSSTFVYVRHGAIFSGCGFINCISIVDAGAVEIAVNQSSVVFDDCIFDNNTAQQGGHIRIDSGEIEISSCTFSKGTASLNGGAIMLASTSITCVITDSTIRNNHAGQFGGGIWMSGKTSIQGCKIDGNTADENGNDIAVEHWGRLTLMDTHSDLLALYAVEDLLPNEWSIETVEEDMGMEVLITTCYTMTFSEPEPEAPNSGGNGDDNAEEPPVIPSRPSGNSSGGQITTKPEEEKTADVALNVPAALVCGEAELDTTKTAYLMGYADGLLGEADTLTRGQAAQIFFRLLTDESMKKAHSDTNNFKDVSADAWYNEAVSTIANAGVIIGGADGSYNPNRTITWAEMVTMFARFVDPCSDRSIITKHWAKDALNTAISYNWIDYKDTFEADAAVTRGEFISFVNTVFDWANN